MDSIKSLQLDLIFRGSEGSIRAMLQWAKESMYNGLCPPQHMSKCKRDIKDGSFILRHIGNSFDLQRCPEPQDTRTI